ncbi:hypothetical protein CCAX7_003380 [Capsulimonas corticalis]|uniref:Uncharacterized protein n=1 Tax=Capsulimonas corticalis TaxID=2219043 RepID=A0A402CS81_9BACT|nr:hypothetical protein [Capsulimonas corticalis]BDI28287.1 hypothetical protein CCAX7_003380 [Capsulimonas corticalis]
MSLLAIDNWLRSPADHDIISRWTVGAGQERSHALSLPQPRDPQRFSFLALGDSGDSESAGPGVSPQDAVAREMVRDTRLAGDSGAVMVLHMGDVVYMTGERRLYDRNFRRPYSPFLTESSTVGDFTFRLPFLPVPGNHDYYDLGAWAKWLANAPLVGAGLRALWHEIMSFNVPEGGSEMGKTYMDAFVDLQADTSLHPLPYALSARTRLPNRYYKFQLGNVDFFALDSNTLDAPSPQADSGQVRQDAADRVTDLEAKARAVDLDIRAARQELETQRDARRLSIAGSAEERMRVTELSLDVGEALERLRELLEGAEMSAAEGRRAAQSVRIAETHWDKAAADLSEASGDGIVRALARQETVSDEVCASLSTLEEFLAVLPEGRPRASILETRLEMERALHAWAISVSPITGDASARLKELSEGALDLQRELALARRRSRFQPEDHDTAQLTWLDRALEESVRLRPNAWRVVYLHHPLYTTIGNHCERSDVLDVRDNLTPILARRAHLMLAGHSHAFEWFRSEALPEMGVFVTGGGGQVTLRPSILSPDRYTRFSGAYDALRRAGVTECASAGAGPAAPDGSDSPLYHYLNIEVTPDKLIVRPIGVRHADDGFRREDPMPVHHTPALPEGRPPFVARSLHAVEITRGAAPQAIWV